MIRVWNLGTAVLITWLGSVFGRGTFLLLASRLRISHPGA